MDGAYDRGGHEGGQDRKGNDRVVDYDVAFKDEYERTAAPWGLVPEEAPDLIEYYMQKQMIYNYENSTLDPKTAKLIALAICAVQNVPIGVYNHSVGAMARGATKQEVLDTLRICAFECAKHGVMGFLEGLNMFLAKLKEEGK